MSEKTTLGENGIYDARSLGVPKMLLLGLQHMFAMFGATILVPMLTGLMFPQHCYLQVWELYCSIC